jgi:hypothetical protein
VDDSANETPGRPLAASLVADLDKVLLAKGPRASRPDVIGLGSVTAIPNLLQARISLAAIIAPVGNGFEFFDTEDILCPRGDVGELCPVRAGVRHLVGHNQVVLGINGDLNVVTDDAGTAATGCHRAAVGISQGDLLVGRSKHLPLIDRKLAHGLLHLRQLLLEPRHLRSQRLRRLLSVGHVKLA